MKSLKRKSSLKKNKSSLKAPNKKGICLKVFTLSPKKPNSANRKVINILSNSLVKTVKIPGEGHNLQQHSTLLIRGGRCRDLIGVKRIAIRGKLDLNGVLNRKTSRSLYGIKNLK